MERALNLIYLAGFLLLAWSIYQGAKALQQERYTGAIAFSVLAIILGIAVGVSIALYPPEILT